MSSFPATSPLHELGPHPEPKNFTFSAQWLASRVDVRVQGGQGRRPLPVVQFEHRRRMIWVMSRVSGNGWAPNKSCHSVGNSLICFSQQFYVFCTRHLHGFRSRLATRNGVSPCCALDGVYIAPNAKASLMHASKQWLLPSECRVRHRNRQRVIFRDNAG
ncbi:hypothetical protein D8B26_002254 [Coccidioides posadasii str. Silveira]|uniref:Predicted protein n=1 Tax=Coccidioides posadasii (strain RMSCC 757 / Silveira) TaxID=443226 RepID=E9DDD1_COCPS|nr:predicted protein [Coccidioides posadasii str. Silveira]QVM07556.1 hypothetical protein D8B26_002254 [Coccidioides posadasii str. Silveira]